MFMSGRGSPGCFLREVTLCWGLGAGECSELQVLSAAPFCCFSRSASGWFLFCFRDWNLEEIPLFHTVKIHRASQTVKRRERKGGQQLQLRRQTLFESVCARHCRGDSETGQIPGSLDSALETASPMPQVLPQLSSLPGLQACA